MNTKALTILAAAGLAVATGGARGQAQSWNNAAGGSAGTAANWTPIGVPTATSDLTFNLLASYPVSFGATVPTSNTQLFRRGTVTLTMTSPHTADSGIAIADLAGDVATVVLTGGSWTSGPGGFVNVGDAAGTTGTFSINDDDADFFVVGTSDLFVGNNGIGTMNITGGGSATIADTMHVGQGSAATGALTVSGFVAQAPFPISTLSVNGLGQSRWGNGGDATVNVTNGGRAIFTGDLVIANLSTSVANVTVQGQGLVTGATIDAAGDLLIGRNTSPAVAAGVGTLNVGTTGRVLVGDTLFLAGDPDGGSGTLHTEINSLVRTRSLAIGGGATLDLDGGELEIDGGSLTWTAGGAPHFNGGAGNPVITLRNGASSTLNAVSGLALVVGGGAGANLIDFDVSSGSDLVTTGSVILGEDPDDIGRMTINGTGSTLTMPTSSALTVGSSGDGRFEAELGGAVTGGTLAIATNPSSTAFVLFENPGTTATFRNVLVGGTAGFLGGSARLLVNAEAVLNVNSGGFVVFPGGTVEVSQSAILHAPDVDALVDGIVELENGAVMSTGIATFRNGSTLRGPNDIAGGATLDSAVRMADGSLLELVNGDLTAGDASRPDGFDAQDGSLVSVGAHTLTLLDANRALVDDVTIAGGHIIAPNGLEVVTQQQDGRLDGFGTITTPELFLVSGGSVITSTGTQGIRINGVFRSASGTIDGTRYSFQTHPDSHQGGWTGAGAINAPVLFGSGTHVNALANMTMGAATPSGVVLSLGSELHADTHVVTLVDSDGVALGSLTTLTGGRIVCAQPLSLGLGQVISGDGRFETPSLTALGTLRPKRFDVPDDFAARLIVTGSLSLSSRTSVELELYGEDADTNPYDNIRANGALSVAGALHVSLAPGFEPTPGNVFVLLSGASRTGEFGLHDIPFNTQIEYTPVAVLLHILCPADFNRDGIVDFFDYLDFAAAFDTEDPSADFNRDGIVDFFDYLDFVARFDAGC